jgi:hypothetical protein
VELEEAEPKLGAGINFTDPNSPLAPYYLQTSHVAAAAVLGFLFLLLNFMALWHTDIWGHMKFGKWMVENGRLPERELFADLAAKDAAYINFQWLSQAGFYLAFHAGEVLAGGDGLRRTAGGVDMLRLTHAVLAVLKYSLLLAAFRRLSGSMWLAIAGVILANVFSTVSFGVLRPQVVAEVFFAGLLLALARPVLSKRALVLIPIAMVLWANSHGSYPIGLILLGGCLAGAVAEWGWPIVRRNVPRNPESALQVRRLFLVLALATAGIACLNPHGPALFLHTLALAKHPNIADMEEWRSVTTNAMMGYGFLATVGVLALTQWLSPRWYTPAQLVLLLGFGVQTYLHQRMAPWWSMLVPWLILSHWAAILGPVPFLTADRSVPSFRKTIMAGLVVWLVLMWSIPMNWLTSGGPRPLERSVHGGTPWQLAVQLQGQEGRPELDAWLKKHFPRGQFQGRVFASETQGDYLIWALPPEIPIFVYTHVHLFPPSVWRQCQRVKFGERDWDDILDRHRVNLVIIEAEMHPPLRELLYEAGDTWQVLLDEAGDHRKADARGRQLIAVRKVPLVNP